MFGLFSQNILILSYDWFILFAMTMVVQTYY